jgi:2-(1,2-epoxy-1,2-dihydrophenyl)acetyl-CoA isomerase
MSPVTTTLPQLSLSGGVATIRLARPDAGNAVDLPTALALRDVVAEIASAAPSVHVVVLRADGRLFCAGGDVRAMAAAADRPAFVAELAGVLHETLEALRALPSPSSRSSRAPPRARAWGSSSRPTWCWPPTT